MPKTEVLFFTKCDMCGGKFMSIYIRIRDQHLCASCFCGQSYDPDREQAVVVTRT